MPPLYKPIWPRCIDTPLARKSMGRMCAVAAATGLLAAQPVTRLQTETRMVQIDVEVRDGQGRPVEGLTKDDFSVSDNEKTRAIQVFSVQKTSAGAAQGPVAAADSPMPRVFTNRNPLPPRDARATVILIDGVNNYWDDFSEARLRLLAMVDKLRSEERIAVYAATSKPAAVAMIQGFTTDRQGLRRTLERYQPPALKPAPGILGRPDLPPNTALLEPSPSGPRLEQFERQTAVRDAMDTFQLLARHLARLPGRKRLLWLTSGLPPRELREMPDPFARASAALNEANVAVDVIDDDGVGDLHRRWGPLSRSTLRGMADATGGRTFSGRNDLENMLVEAIETDRVTYTLGFYLPEEDRDGRFHELTVRAARAGLSLSHRKGYYAGEAPPVKGELLEAAALNPADATDIAITAEIERSGGEQPMLRVNVTLDPAQLTFTRAAGEYSARFDELFLLTDASGSVLGKVQAGREYRAPNTPESPLRHQQELRDLPGAMRLLIVVRDKETGKTGSLAIPLV